MPTLDLDWRLRLAAFHALDRLRRAGDGLVTGGQLTYGFELEGERIPFFNLRMGIWKPRQAEAALTIVTSWQEATVRRPGGVGRRLVPVSLPGNRPRILDQRRRPPSDGRAPPHHLSVRRRARGLKAALGAAARRRVLKHA